MNKSEIPAAQKAVLGMLMDDHRKVKKLFKDFKSEKDASRKEEIVREACTELTVHAELEEQQFYPFLREQDEKTFGDLLNEAKVEHASAKDLIAQLLEMGPSDELYDARFTVLGEYVNHHITEEEDELFVKIISKRVDLKELEPVLRELKQDLMENTPGV
jgi:hemerythrin-like domain-containing protein